MSGAVKGRAMKNVSRLAEVEALIREIQRYLGYLDALRGQPPEPPARREGKKP